jgi:hypothetical protein
VPSRLLRCPTLLVLLLLLLLLLVVVLLLLVLLLLLQLLPPPPPPRRRRPAPGYRLHTPLLHHAMRQIHRRWLLAPATATLNCPGANSSGGGRGSGRRPATALL